jgi:hypothetical protein
MVALLRGRLDWGMQRTPENGRDYGITWLLRTTSLEDGPSTVMLCPDLPRIGDPWNFGTESDPWAFCRPDWTIECVSKGEPGIYWTVSQTFSTRPLFRCQDFQFDNPLLEPIQISGSFVNYTKEIKFNYDGTIPRMSSHEMVRGSIMEFDHSKPTVSISANLATLELETFSALQNHLNDATLWGLPRRCIKLSNTTWQRKVLGICTFYYTKTYEFDIDPNTFDRPYSDFGSRVLIGWSPGSRYAPLDPFAADPSFGGVAKWLNPANFELYRDINGDVIEEIPLDGFGRPLTSWDAPAEGLIYYYPEGNFLALDGVPSTLE